jgi:glutamine cyclotransferase
LEDEVFGEGLTVVGDRLIQLTWKAGRALVYDTRRLREVDEFRFEGEGWGITKVGGRHVISDGSSVLKVMDPQDHRVVATVQVRDRGRPVVGLNGLENVDGLVYANVWPTDCIAQIDPADGRVVGWLDLSGLFPHAQRPNRAAVANGIAYDAANKRLYVTGKSWPYVFEIEPAPVAAEARTRLPP